METMTTVAASTMGALPVWCWLLSTALICALMMASVQVGYDRVQAWMFRRRVASVSDRMLPIMSPGAEVPNCPCQDGGPGRCQGGGGPVDVG
ncbi:hypothetical protein [Streptomyces alboflavus]|uniref:hypothetical protein n=1 Tax=Streptomyces alboflavus TaxID=67267 RepID=UPI0036B42CB0